MSDLCRREGIKPHSYYGWTKESMEAGKERLARDTVRDASQQEVQQLKRGERGTQAVGGGVIPGGVPSEKNGSSRCLTTPQVPKDERRGEGGGAGQGGFLRPPQA